MMLRLRKTRWWVRFRRWRRRGSGLLIAVVLMAVAFLALAGAVSWGAHVVRANHRASQHARSVAAAHAAVEKVFSHVANEFYEKGEAPPDERLDWYRTQIPEAAESSAWQQYDFADGAGHGSRTWIARTGTWSYENIIGAFSGLRGMSAGYRIISDAQERNSLLSVVGSVQQDVQLASIPVFGFGIFYALDLELNPGAAMDVTGWVHSNADIYLQPAGALTFRKRVTAAGDIVHGKKAGDPVVRSPAAIRYDGGSSFGVSPLLLPIGTNKPAGGLRFLLEPPPAGEDMDSLLGRQRYYNKADLILVLTDDRISVKTGPKRGLVELPFVNPASLAPQVSDFVNTNVLWYDKREQKTVNGIDINIAVLRVWMLANDTFRPLIGDVLGEELKILYVADLRTQTASTQTGLRLVMGRTLPSKGLTVATPNPLYVLGHFNCPDSSDLGSTNTAGAAPASLVGDSVTVLSDAWNDLDGHLGIIGSLLGKRKASDTTVNAAILTGIVPTRDESYSGGAENLIRLLEDWTGRTLTFNGSLVALFESAIARTPWGEPDVYFTPERRWSFDSNFRAQEKLPPGTPYVQASVRGTWQTIAPGTAASR